VQPIAAQRSSGLSLIATGGSSSAAAALSRASSRSADSTPRSISAPPSSRLGVHSSSYSSRSAARSGVSPSAVADRGSPVRQALCLGASGRARARPHRQHGRPEMTPGPCGSAEASRGNAAGGHFAAPTLQGPAPGVALRQPLTPTRSVRSVKSTAASPCVRPAAVASSVTSWQRGTKTAARLASGCLPGHGFGARDRRTADTPRSRSPVRAIGALEAMHRGALQPEWRPPPPLVGGLPSRRARLFTRHDQSSPGACVLLVGRCDADPCSLLLPSPARRQIPPNASCLGKFVRSPITQCSEQCLLARGSASSSQLKHAVGRSASACLQTTVDCDSARAATAAERNVDPGRQGLASAASGKSGRVAGR